MRAISVFIAASLLAAMGFAAPSHASPGRAEVFPSCDKLLAKYPNGVAKSKAAASKAVKEGFERPKVSSSLYRTNGARLDRDNDGVMCEQDRTRTISFKTDFGIVTTESVKAPRSGECVNVPVTLDIRNVAPIGGLVMTVRLVSEFGSVVGYEEVSVSPEIAYPYTFSQPGVYGMSLKACGDTHSWTHISGNRQQVVSGVKLDERMTLSFAVWLSGKPLGSATYSWY